MAIYYLDYVNGNDANNGTTWALAWKTITSGATAARIAPGDTIRIAKSPDPTSLGVNGTWVDGPCGVAQSIVSSTTATPIVVTVTGHGMVAGDIVVIGSHTTNTNANGVWKIGSATTDTFTLIKESGSNSVGNGAGGATGTARKITNSVITLSAPVTKNIALCGNTSDKVAWTASANATTYLFDLNDRSGYGLQQINTLAAFTTGKVAYAPISPSLDLSGYQQLSLWFKQNAGTLCAAGDISIALCSDSAGATVVNSLSLPAVGMLNYGFAVTVDFGSALGSAISSVALYCNSDKGAQTFEVSCIIACKAPASADSLSLTSLIGKNTGTEPWLGIQSINNTWVVLDNGGTVPTGTNMRGYSGTAETVTAYKRETIKTTQATAAATQIQALQDVGLDGSLITFEGGYNTSTSTVDGDTIFDGQNFQGYGLYAPQVTSFNSVSLSFVKYSYGVYSFATEFYVTAKNLNNNSFAGLAYPVGAGCLADIENACCNTNYGVQCNIPNSAIYVVNASGNGITGVISSGQSGVTTIGKANNNGTYGASASNAKCVLGDSSGNGSASVVTSGVAYFSNSYLTSTTKVYSTPYGNTFVWSTAENGNTDSNFGYTDGGLISTDTATRHTASGLSWKISPTTTARSASYPLQLKIATVACAASVAVTVSAWFRRDNTGITARLRAPADTFYGVTEQVDTMTAAADTWEQLSVTVTPSQKGVLEFYAECYGGTSYSCYVDDVTIT